MECQKLWRKIWRKRKDVQKNKHLERVFLLHQYLPASLGGQGWGWKHTPVRCWARAQRMVLVETSASAPPAAAHSTVNTELSTEPKAWKVEVRPPDYTEPVRLSGKNEQTSLSSVPCDLATGLRSITLSFCLQQIRVGCAAATTGTTAPGRLSSLWLLGGQTATHRLHFFTKGNHSNFLSFFLFFFFLTAFLGV